MEDFSRIIVAVGPVIIEDGKVLLVRDIKDEWWKFPGGKLEESDGDLVATMQREAKEELGITVSPVAPLDPFLLRGDDSTRVLISYYALRSGNIVSSSEIVEWKWFSLEKLPSRIAPNVLPALDSLLRLYGED